MRVAGEEIKCNRAGGDKHRLLRAYIELSGLKKYKPEAHKNAKLALEIYEQLSSDEQDLHDLDDINTLLKF